MGTKRSAEDSGRTGPGSTRSGGRLSRHRLEKIPIPPFPAFRTIAARIPGRGLDPGGNPPAETARPAAPGPGAFSPNAISDEEADLLLGVTPPAAPAGSPRADDHPLIPPAAAAGSPERSEGELTEVEGDELLGLAPGPTLPAPGRPAETCRPAAPARSGASGAAMLNELVDEIEKDLERDRDRHAPPVQARSYGRTIGCWVSPLADAQDPQPPTAVSRKQEEEETP